MKNLLKIICLFLIAVLILSCSNDDDDEKESTDGDVIQTKTIKIASINSISVAKESSEDKNNGAILAIDEINDAGGITIDGVKHNFEIVLVDDGGDSATGIAELGKVFNDGVKFAVGPAWSGVTLGEEPDYKEDMIDGVADFAIKNGILLVSQSATSAAITNLEDRDFVWRTCPSDAFQGEIGADYTYNTLGKKNAGIIYRNDAYGNGLAETYKRVFAEKGGTVDEKNVVSYETDATEFKEKLEAVFDGKPDVIFLLSYSSDAAAISKDIKKYDLLNKVYGEKANWPLIFSTDGPGVDLLVNGEPEILEIMMGTDTIADEESLNYKAFLDKFEKKFKYTPGTYPENAYDAVYLIAFAIQKAGSVDPEKVKTHLVKLSRKDDGDTVINVGEFSKGVDAIIEGKGINYEGASGLIELDENGDPGSGMYEIWEIIKDGDEYKFNTKKKIMYP